MDFSVVAGEAEDIRLETDFVCHVFESRVYNSAYSASLTPTLLATSALPSKSVEAYEHEYSWVVSILYIKNKLYKISLQLQYIARTLTTSLLVGKIIQNAMHASFCLGVQEERVRLIECILIRIFTILFIQFIQV